MDTTVLEPDERTEDDRLLLLVPVRSGRCGSIAVRTGRLPDGRRVGLAFTCEAALAAVFGPEQKWIPLNARVARWMFAEAGAVETRVDAVPFAPASALMPASAPLAATLLPEPSRAIVPAPLPTSLPTPLPTSLPTSLPTPRPERATVAIAPKPLVALQTITPTSIATSTPTATLTLAPTRRRAGARIRLAARHAH